MSISKKRERKETKSNDEMGIYLVENTSMTIRDIESGSRAWLPVRADEGYDFEIVKIDKGIITDIPDGKSVCDNLIYSIPKKIGGYNITWIVELKGTKRDDKVGHAIEQITDTIGYLLDKEQYPEAQKYMQKRDLVFGLIVGAPDKTLPAFAKEDVKRLCQRLFKQSLKRKQIKDLYSLVFNIQPRKGHKARCEGKSSPYTITCYNSNGCEIPLPSMFTDMVL